MIGSGLDYLRIRRTNVDGVNARFVPRSSVASYIRKGFGLQEMQLHHFRGVSPDEGFLAAVYNTEVPGVQE